MNYCTNIMCCEERQYRDSLHTSCCFLKISLSLFIRNSDSSPERNQLGNLSISNSGFEPATVLHLQIASHLQHLSRAPGSWGKTTIIEECCFYVSSKIVVHYTPHTSWCCTTVEVNLFSFMLSRSNYFIGIYDRCAYAFLNAAHPSEFFSSMRTMLYNF